MLAATEYRLALMPPAAGVRSVVASDVKLLTTLMLPAVIIPSLVSEASNVPAAYEYPVIRPAEATANVMLSTFAFAVELP
ncbi:hypothetical protein SDC9_80848 [bioreactor metagenome]|uniref:Uncharacterized protein n=1 Tax=bioreactor metagenome TaxID=1076179 RepID=A0A644Z0B3_9ZZZZ